MPEIFNYGQLHGNFVRVPWEDSPFREGFAQRRLTGEFNNRDRAAIFLILFVQRAYVNTIECIHGDGIVRRLEMSNCAILDFKSLFEIATRKFHLGLESRMTGCVSAQFVVRSLNLSFIF